MSAAPPGQIGLILSKSIPALWQAYLNIASGWPALNITTSAPSSFFHAKSGSASRPVRKKPSISLICAKCTAGGVSPLSSGPKPWLSADCATCAEPSLSASIADMPGGETDHCGSRPSASRNPPDMVEMSGE